MQTVQFNFKQVLVILAIVSLTLVSSAIFTSQAMAANGINRTINFQGRLVRNDSGNVGLNVANTAYSVVFTFYNNPNAGQGTALWTGTYSVTTVDGIFRVALGSGAYPIPANFNFNWDGLYLGMAVGADAEMTPRIQMAAVPFAFNAQQVAGLTIQDSTSGAASTSATLKIGDTTTPVTIDMGAVSGKALVFANIQATGNLSALSNSTSQSGDVVGLNLTLSGANGSYSQTGIKFNLTGGTGANYFDLYGSGGAWSITRAGAFGLTNGTVYGNNGDCLKSGGSATSAMTFGTCGSGGGTNYWNLTNGNGFANQGYFAPVNSTADLLIGGQSTASATFAVLGLATNNLGGVGGHQTTASVSGNLVIMPNNGYGGSIGIGTTAPSQQLEIKGSGSSDFTVQNNWLYGAGAWLNMSTDGPSGIGSGGAGSNAWIAYVSQLGQWFSDSAIGDIVYRNTAGKLLFGNSGGTATMAITGGNVGIGMTGPNHTLDVNGNIGLAAGNYINFGATDGTSGYGFFDNGGVMQVKNSGGSWVNIPTSGTTQWTTSGSNIYFATGNVGIRTAAPLASLQVNGAYGSNAALIVNQLNSGDLFTASASGATKFIISNSGYVGIGTTSTTTTFPLTVNGVVFFGSGTLTNISAAPLTLENSAASTMKTQLNLVNTAGGSGAGSAIDFFTYDISGGTSPGLRIAGIDNNFSADFTISTKTPGAAANSLVERFRITNSGYVGIGTTTTPAQLLEVNGSAQVDTNLLVNGYIANSANTANFPGIGSGLNGITFGNGTIGSVFLYNDIVGAKEAIGTAGWGMTFFKQSSTDSTYYQTFQIAGGSGASMGATGYNFNIGTTTAVAINSSGLLGIGTTAPLAPLQVNGAYGSNAALIVNQLNNGDILTASNSGTSVFTVSKNGATTLLSSTGQTSGSILTVDKAAAALAGALNGIYLDVSGMTAVQIGANTLTALNMVGFQGGTGSNYGLNVGTITGSGSSVNYGMNITNVTGGGTNYGLYINTIASSGSNYAIYSNAPAKSYFKGNLGLGTTTPRAQLDVVTNQTATASAFIENSTTTAASVGLAIKMGATTPGTTTHLANFLDLNGRIRGSISFNAAGTGVAYNLGGIADLAEYLAKDPNQNIDWGSILCQNSSGNVEPCQSKSAHIAGVASESPGFVGGEDLGNSSITVGFTGVVSTRVVGIIKSGDYIAMSDTVGVGTKAITAGQVVGVALEDYNSDQVGKIYVKVSPSWYDPQVQLTSSGDLSLVDQNASDANFTIPHFYTLNDALGNPLQRVGEFSDSAIANLRAGFINAGQITTNVLSVATENVTIGGQSLKNYITTIVANAISNGQAVTSTLAAVDVLQANLIVPLDSNSSVALKLDNNQLSILNNNSASGLTVASIDNLGNASFSGQLTAVGGQFSEATVSGVLHVGKLIDDEIGGGLDVLTNQIAALNNSMAVLSASTQSARLATASAQLPTTLTLSSLNVDGLATVSGDLNVRGNGFFQGALNVLDSITTNNLLVSQFAYFINDVVFKGNVRFNGTPTFNNDTAGFAVIKQGQGMVQVTFDQEYANNPIVTASIALDKVGDDVAQKQLEDAILNGNISHIITQRTTKGFVIRLNKPAEEDLNFSWVALSVTNVKTSGINPVAPTPVPSATQSAAFQSILNQIETPTPTP